MLKKRVVLYFVFFTFHILYAKTFSQSFIEKNAILSVLDYEKNNLSEGSTLLESIEFLAPLLHIIPLIKLSKALKSYIQD